MRKYPYQELDDNHDDGHYWISISDLMTSLLFIFILILGYTIFTFSEKNENLEVKREELERVQKKLEEREKQLDSAQKLITQLQANFDSRAELLKDIQKDLRAGNIDIDIDPENGNLRIRSDSFFEVGSAELSDEGKLKMAKIAKAIQDNLEKNPKFQKAIDTIFIEGHTDNVSLYRRYGVLEWTNMELSAQRAINTFKEMDKATEISKMKNASGKYLFSYSGYADQRPFKSNNTDEGRAQNRRIELFFALTSPQLISHQEK